MRIPSVFSSRPGRRALKRWLVAFLLVLAGGIGLPQPPAAEAQTTGGSFGGGSFGGGGGGHSYGGGGGSYGGGGSFGGFHASSGHYSGGGGGCGSFALGLVVFVLIGVVRMSLARRANRYSSDPVTSGPLVPYAPLVDVSAIRLALDWRARPAVQKRLEELARAGHTSSPGGLAYLLHETVVELRRVEASWLYAGAVNALPTQAARAEQHFRSIVSEARSRFKVETVRAVDGHVAGTDAPAMRARADEGAGLVVVTLVVAATREIPDITKATDAHELQSLMRDLGALTARDMVALEVIWSPTAENDRLSSAELEVLYPELRLLDESTVVGRVFCGYCAQPFPAELLRCPSCGAPGSAAKRAGA